MRNSRPPARLLADPSELTTQSIGRPAGPGGGHGGRDRHQGHVLGVLQLGGALLAQRVAHQLHGHGQAADGGQEIAAVAGAVQPDDDPQAVQGVLFLAFHAADAFQRRPRLGRRAQIMQGANSTASNSFSILALHPSTLDPQLITPCNGRATAGTSRGGSCRGRCPASRLLIRSSAIVSLSTVLLGRMSSARIDAAERDFPRLVVVLDRRGGPR